MHGTEDEIKRKEEKLSVLHAEIATGKNQLKSHQGTAIAISAKCPSMMDDINFTRSFIGLMRYDDPDAVRAVAGIILGYCARNLIHENQEITDLVDRELNLSGSVHLSSEDASNLCSVLIHGRLRLGSDGIAGVSYPGNIRMIEGDEYEKEIKWKENTNELSMQIQDGLAKLKAEREDFERSLLSYGRDFRSFMEDYLAGLADFGRATSEIIFHTVREVLREKINELLDPESIVNMIRDYYSSAARSFFSYTDVTKILVLQPLMPPSSRLC